MTAITVLVGYHHARCCRKQSALSHETFSDAADVIAQQQMIACLKAALLVCRHIKRSMHGTHMMSTGEIREAYGRELVNLRNEGRWTFLNTLFSVSEAVMYMQAGHFASKAHGNVDILCCDNS